MRALRHRLTHFQLHKRKSLVHKETEYHSSYPQTCTSTILLPTSPPTPVRVVTGAQHLEHNARPLYRSGGLPRSPSLMSLCRLEALWTISRQQVLGSRMRLLWILSPRLQDQPKLTVNQEVRLRKLLKGIPSGWLPRFMIRTLRRGGQQNFQTF